MRAKSGNFDREGFLALIERTLDEVLPAEDARPAVLSEAMRYAVGTGGKRMRPLICLAAAKAVGGRIADAKYPAAAIELLHNYTLIHDDLPAMDNDVERRGKPTVWKKFGEANAILVGDALLSLAYEVAAKAPRKTAAVVGKLGRYGVGVVRGQVEDIASEKDIDFIYEHKTADLFMAAAEMGALAGGGDEKSVLAVSKFALNAGFAFQLQDDLLDGDSPYSVTRTKAEVELRYRRASRELGKLPGDTSALAGILRLLKNRKA